MDHEERARVFLNLPQASRTPTVLAAMLADAFQEGRRHGERWTETALAHWLAESVAGEPEDVREALMERSEQVQSRDWRRPEFQSSSNLEAESAVAMAMVSAVSRETGSGGGG